MVSLKSCHLDSWGFFMRSIILFALSWSYMDFNLFFFFDFLFCFSHILTLDLEKLRIRPDITLFIILFLFYNNLISLYIFATASIIVASIIVIVTWIRDTDFKALSTFIISLNIALYFTLVNNLCLALSFQIIGIRC